MDAVGGEELDDSDAAEVAPVGTVGGPDEGGIVEVDVFPRDEAGAVGEDDVVLGEAFFY